MTDPILLESEAIRRMQIVDEANYLEAMRGANALTDYLRKHLRRPDPATAADIGRLLGWQVRAEDGKLYPPLTKAQKQWRRDVREKRKVQAKEFNDAHAFVSAVRWLAEITTSPATMLRKLDYNRHFAERTLDELAPAISILNRVAALMRAGNPSNDK